MSMTISGLDRAISDLRNNYNQNVGRLRSAEDRLRNLEEDKAERQSLEVMYREELAVILSAGAQQLELAANQLAGAASYAIQQVFGEEYEELTIKTDASGSATIAEIFIHKYFEGDIVTTDPFENNGGGVNDVISGLLKISALEGYDPPIENALLSDEMSKHVSEEYREAFALVLRELSHRLNRQVILSTHDSALTVASDNIIRF